MSRELRNGVLGETSAESYARLTQTKVIASYTPSSKSIRTSSSYGSRTAPTVIDKPLVEIQAKTIQPQGITPIKLLVGGFDYGTYFPSMLSKSPIGAVALSTGSKLKDFYLRLDTSLGGYLPYGIPVSTGLTTGLKDRTLQHLKTAAERTIKYFQPFTAIKPALDLREVLGFPKVSELKTVSDIYIPKETSFLRDVTTTIKELPSKVAEVPEKITSALKWGVALIVGAVVLVFLIKK